MNSTKGDLVFLNQRIVETVDWLLKCPKNREDNLITRLRSLWKQRTTVLTVAAEDPSTTEADVWPKVSRPTGDEVGLEKSPES